MSDFPPFLCISASAGSGKTFQLAHRVLRLLAMRVPPDEIGAYTFSRKAAGEIFDGIVTCLREAASDEAIAETTANRIGMDHSRQEFLADLRTVFHHLHRLRIGTLDSRISHMLSAASVELGLPPEFSVMDSQSAEYLRLQSRVLNRLFQGEQLDDTRADTFLQLFEQATHGQAEKNFQRRMERFLEEHRTTFLAVSSPEAWRGPDITEPPATLPEDQRLATAALLREAIPERIPNRRTSENLLKLVDDCAAMHSQSIWSRDAPSGALWKTLLENDSPVFTYSRKEFDLGEDLWAYLRPLIDHVVAVSWNQARNHTLALYGFLLAYEATYRRQVLPGGILSFDDACTLMSGFDQLEPVELAYRLDGEVSHWLLDEFQDTNRLQWNVLRPFLEEVLQDPERRRSFFYVGDVKQAIYAWRGGDSTLFGQILKEWPSIKKVEMDRSFRSAQPVLDLVNHVMDGIPRVEDLPDEAVERWNAEFTPHTADNSALSGHADVLQCEEKDGIPEAVLRVVETVPAGAETAILVRSNNEGAEIANLLRSEGHRVSLEGTSEIRDDTAVEAVLAALHLAAHPADTFSRQLVRLAGLDVEPFSLLRDLQSEGVTAAVRRLIAKLSLDPDAAFSRARLQRLVDVALEFDTLGDPSADRFLAYVDRVHIKENEARGVIRIMTIHQSKGLGFDVVILPVKSGPSNSVASVDSNHMATSPIDAASPWVTLLPPKDVCMRIPELGEIYDSVLSESAYESFCVLYVALTRAKQSLHVVLDTPPKTGGSLNQLHNWLASRLEGTPAPNAGKIPNTRTLAVFGDANSLSIRKRESTPNVAPLPFPLKAGARVTQRLEPSQADAQTREVAQAFRFFAHDGRALGSRVHDLLEQLDWADGVDVDAFLATHDEPADSDAAAHIRQALRFPQLRKPDDATALWREQKFETVLDEGWVTGIFDRVVLFEDRAWIQDYKTNLSCDERTVEHYAPQMRLYRDVLTDMLRLDPAAITCQLLFTHTGDVKEIA